MKPEPASFFRSTLLTQVLKFAAVGGLGFVIDACVLYVLVSFGTNAFIARIISFGVAVCVTWYANSRWTFNATRASLSRMHMIAYFALQTFSALVNFGVYTMVILQIGITPLNSVIALACGSAVGMVLNFVGARLLLDRRDTPS